ncbi:hypothetical protein C8A01DRAFT_45709 [Parachaetomium inaequale]|uniref:C2H2-type domain-containing protein n=1 Tax=Parachaetomium inaequale TaxID=2588326 RepID=A0AAN6PHI1_9PEZI|nr:hypothetical protein C8A01DRAFT_45709 [Parachaetomium inaequale]
MKRSREPEEAPHEDAAPTDRNPGAAAGDGHGGLKHQSGDGDASPPAAKIAGLDLSCDDGDRGIEMRCSLPPHKEPVVFSSYSAYEAHYRDQHTNRCAQCRRNFPSAHLLGLHIEETHDSFAQVRREKGERTYGCFVEGCERKCSTPQKRKMHLVDKHMYPKNFFFAITREGIDGRRSLLLEDRGHGRRRRSSAAAAPRPQPSQGQGQEPVATEKRAASADGRPATESSRKSPEQQPDQEMEDLSSAMSSLRFVPMSVRFGRGKTAGFAKR